MKPHFTALLVIASFATQAGAEEKAIKKGKTQSNTIGMKLKLIKSGAFRMECPASEFAPAESQRVRITRDFYLGVTEVTQGQWLAVMGTRPWRGKPYIREGVDYAVTYVSWNDAVAFCKRLGEKEKATYRLPTEAEWEYACRAGTTTTYSFGGDKKKLGDHAWFGGLYGDGNAKNEWYAHKVGTKRPNPWGLYDMHGNVWEWCQDRYVRYKKGDVVKDPSGPSKGSGRVGRGGSWYSFGWLCQSGFRYWDRPALRHGSFGFRVVRVPPAEKKPVTESKERKAKLP